MDHQKPQRIVEKIKIVDSIVSSTVSFISKFLACKSTEYLILNTFNLGI